MKKIKILQQTKKQCSTALVLCAVFMLLSITGKAQSENNIMPLNAEKPSFYKYEIAISCGGLSNPTTFFPSTNLLIFIPSFNIEYYYNFNHRHSLIGALNFATDYINQVKLTDKVSKDPYFADIPKEKCGTSFFNSIQIGYRFIYYAISQWTLYGSVFGGLDMMYYNTKALKDEHLWFSPAIQINPFGILYGKNNHRLSVELGFGTHGILSVGYHYVFNNRK